MTVTYEGVHGHSYWLGPDTVARSVREWGDVQPDPRKWWGWALDSARQESERLAVVLPGSQAYWAWRKHYLVLRNDLSRLGWRYDFAPITRPTAWGAL